MPAGSEPGTGSHRTHTIMDGDTLASLAQRYLGDAGRAGEIYEANREVLPEPDILPIGRQIRIPPVERPKEDESAVPSQPPLVPVRLKNS